MSASIRSAQRAFVWIAWLWPGPAKNSQPLNEVKLILVGRGGAGKTSTVRALLGEPFDTHEKSTPGIALCDLPLKDCKGGPVTAHVWDFAGQVITQAAKQHLQMGGPGGG